MTREQPRPGTWDEWLEEKEVRDLLDSIFDDDDDD